MEKIKYAFSSKRWLDFIDVVEVVIVIVLSILIPVTAPLWGPPVLLWKWLFNNKDR